MARPDKLQLFDFSFRAMGSPCHLHLYARDQASAQRLNLLLQEEAERLEQKYSRYRSSSLLSRINASAGSSAAFEVDQETSALLDYASVCFEQSAGLFDISSGVLRQCWNFKDFHLRPAVPTAETLAAVLTRVGWQKIGWDKPLLRLPAGMEIDLGGLVKEYAADCMAGLALQHGIRHGLIELGGDIRVIGPHCDGRPWTIGISHPLQPELALASLELQQGALATSGTYERCFELDGKRYHHILNPLSGWPVSGMASVSVVAEHCLIAGSAATIALLQEHAAPEWLQELGLPWLAVTNGFAVKGTLATATPH